MLRFNDFNKKIHNKEYKIVKSRSGLPIVVLPNPLSQDDGEEEDERELVGREVEVTITDFDVEDENDEPVKKGRTIPQQVQQVCDYITRHF